MLKSNPMQLTFSFASANYNLRANYAIIAGLAELWTKPRCYVLNCWNEAQTIITVSYGHLETKSYSKYCEECEKTAR